MFRLVVALFGGAVVLFSACAPQPTGCNDVSISTENDWRGFLASHCTEVTGRFGFSPQGFKPTPEATSLITIGGTLDVFGDDVTTLPFPALKTVRGALRLQTNRGMTSLNLPELTTVGLTPMQGFPVSLELRDLPALTTVSLPKLAAVGSDTLGDLELSDLPVLTSVDLRELRSVNASLHLYGLTALTSFSAPSLTTVGTLSIEGLNGKTRNEALTTVSLPLLDTVSGDFVLLTNPVLSSVQLPALTSVGTFNVTGNGALRQCVVDALFAKLSPAPPVYAGAPNGGMPNTCP